MNMYTGAPALQLDPLIYKKEKVLFFLSAVISALFWLALIVGTLGVALIYLLLLFIGYLFVQSALIAWIKGNGVKLREDQFPDLHQRYVHCCRKLGLHEYPDVYLMNSDGILNAFATRFLGRDFVVLFSSVVDAMEDNPDAINFYMGHELCHIQRRHLTRGPFLWPASILPLLGAAYSRAREYTCDQYGRACCDDPQSALQGLTLLAAGEKRWATLNIPTYLTQAQATGGFWMSFHELVADYPWLVKRAARVADPDFKAPSRNPLAWLFALFVPRLGTGAGVAGVMVMVAIVGVLAAVALPAYQEYVARTQFAEAYLYDEEADAQLTDQDRLAKVQLEEAYLYGEAAADAVAEYYYEYQEAPPDLESTNFSALVPDHVDSIEVNPANAVVIVTMASGSVANQSFVLIPYLDDDDMIHWECVSDEINPELLPAPCL